jgi:hypothetical protein
MFQSVEEGGELAVSEEDGVDSAVGSAVGAAAAFLRGGMALAGGGGGWSGKVRR